MYNVCMTVMSSSMSTLNTKACFCDAIIREAMDMGRGFCEVSDGVRVENVSSERFSGRC